MEVEKDGLESFPIFFSSGYKKTRGGSHNSTKNCKY